MLPRISIITPSFNQAQFLEQTMDSVLSQNYPNLEYMVVDGGSTDGSVDIIRKYEKHLAFWVSEKDRGQTHAINKGLARATGSIIAYLNSDDYYLPDALAKVADYHQGHPEVDLIHGRCAVVDVSGNCVGERCGDITRYDEIIDLWNVWWKKRNFVQPEVFWTSQIMNRIGLFREDLHWVMDQEYWIRILRAGGKVGRIDRSIACFRLQPNQKSCFATRCAEEQLAMVKQFIWESSGQLSWRKQTCLKGNWVFDAIFRREAERSLSRGETRLRRWLRLTWLSLRHPVICATPFFWQRVANSIHISKCASAV